MGRQSGSERREAQKAIREARGPVFTRGAGGGQGNRARNQVTVQEPAAPTPEVVVQQSINSSIPNVTGRDEVRGGASGTQTSPISPNFPELLKTLQSNGMNLGYQSVTMPTQGQVNSNQTIGLGSATIASGINAGRTVNANDPNFQAYVDGEERIGTNEVTFEPEKGKGSGISQRSRAFLDGGPDSMLALRAAEASQGYIRQNGRNFAIDAEGNPQGEFSDEGRKQLVSQGEGNANSQAFLDQYKVQSGLVTPAEAQSADSQAPVPATAMNPMQIASQQFTPLDQAEFQPKDQPVLGSGPDVDLDTNYFTNGGNVMFNGSLREPLMRYN